MQLQATHLRQEQERRQVLTDQVLAVTLIVTGIDGYGAGKRRSGAPVLLVEALTVHSVRKPGGEHGAAGEMRQQPGRHPGQIPEEIPFGERLGPWSPRPEGLIEVREGYVVAFNLHDDPLLPCVELLEHGSQVSIDLAHPTFRVLRGARVARVRARAGGFGFAAPFRAASTLRLSASARSMTRVSRTAGAWTTCLPSSLASISSASASR